MLATNKSPRRWSLKSRSDIDRLLKNGHRYVGQHCRIIWEESESFKYAILLSGKFRNAAQRNHLKRLFREAIRLKRSLLEKPVAIALVVRPPKNEPEFKDIDGDIERVFKHIAGRQN